jgi:hypothetical protein
MSATACALNIYIDRHIRKQTNALIFQLKVTKIIERKLISPSSNSPVHSKDE